MTVPGVSVQTAACLGLGFCMTVDGFQIQMAGLNHGGSTDPGASQVSTKKLTVGRGTAEAVKEFTAGRQQRLVTTQVRSWAGSASSSTPPGSIQRTLSLTHKTQKGSTGEMAQWLKNTSCLSKGPRFNSQQLHGDSRPSVTPVPGHPIPLLTSTGTASTWCMDMHAGKTSLKKWPWLVHNI